MSTQDHALDNAFDDEIDSPWPALGWIILAAMVTVVAFLVAPLP